MSNGSFIEDLKKLKGIPDGTWTRPGGSVLWCVAEPMWCLFEKCPHYNLPKHVSLSDGGSTAWRFFIDQLVNEQLPTHMKEYTGSWAGRDHDLAREMSGRVNADEAGKLNPGLRVLVEWIHFVTGQSSNCPECVTPSQNKVVRGSWFVVRGYQTWFVLLFAVTISLFLRYFLHPQ